MNKYRYSRRKAAFATLCCTFTVILALVLTFDITFGVLQARSAAAEALTTTATSTTSTGPTSTTTTITTTTTNAPTTPPEPEIIVGNIDTSDLNNTLFNLNQVIVPDGFFILVSKQPGPVYAPETPDPEMLPESINEATLSLNPDDIICIAIYNASNSTGLTPVEEKKIQYRSFCFTEIGFPGVSLCWNGSDYCTYPIQPLGFAGPELVDFSEVEQWVQDNVTMGLQPNPTSGCFEGFFDFVGTRNMPLPPQIRVGVVPHYMIITTLASPGTFQVVLPFSRHPSRLDIGAAYLVDVEWGDTTMDEELSTASNAGGPLTHVYSGQGPFQVRIAGTAGSWSSRGGSPIKGLMQSLTQWGTVITGHVDFYDELRQGSMVIDAPDQPNPTLRSVRDFLHNAGSQPLTRGFYGSPFSTMNTSWVLPNVFDADDAFNRLDIGVDISGWQFPGITSAKRAFELTIFRGTNAPQVWGASSGFLFCERMFQFTTWTEPSTFGPLFRLCQQANAAFGSGRFVDGCDMSEMDVSQVVDGANLFFQINAAGGTFVAPGRFSSMTSMTQFFQRKQGGDVDFSRSSFPMARNADNAFSSSGLGSNVFNTEVPDVFDSLQSARFMFSSASQNNCTFTHLRFPSLTTANDMFFRFGGCSVVPFRGPIYFPLLTTGPSMFNGISRMGSMANLFTPNLIIASGFFAGNTIQEDIGSETWEFPAVQNAQFFVNNCNFQNRRFFVQGWNMQSLTNALQVYQSVSNMGQGSILNMTDWNLSRITTLGSFMRGTRATGTGAEIYVNGWNVSSVRNLDSFMTSTLNLRVYGFETWDVREVRNMARMFSRSDFPKYQTIDLSSWQPNNLITMFETFAVFGGTRNIDVTGWNTNTLTTLSRTWFQTRMLAGVATWDVSSVISMSGMSSNTPNGVHTALVGTWNPMNLQDAASAFSLCNSNIDLSSWSNTNMLTNANQMFLSARGTLTNIGSLDVSAVTDMTRMFQQANGNVDASQWNLASVTAVFNILGETYMEESNYDSILIAFSQNSTLNNAVMGNVRSAPWGLTGGNGSPLTTYSAAAASARADLISRGWSLSDGGQS